MTDIQTPSSAIMSTINAGASATDKSQKPKPEKPDEQQYKVNVEKAEAELKAVQEKQDATRTQFENALSSNKESPANRRLQELRDEVQSIKQQQSKSKISRGGIQDKIATLDTQLKSRISEQKVARGRVPYKSVDDIDREIQRLEKGVDAGTMKLVDERKALADISNLRKQRKGFSRFEEADAAIDDVKKQISELRKTLDSPESRSLSKRYDEIQAEITAIRAEQESTNKNISSIREERNKLNTIQQEKYSAVKDIRSQYNKAKKAHYDYEFEQRKIRAERAKAENEAYQKERRRKIAEKKLEEASEPAFGNEILAAEGLIRYFDPTYAEATKSLRGPSGFAAEAQRSVDGSDIKGTRVSKKEDREENYFMGNGGKKGKKGKKGNNTGSPAPSTPTEGKFNLSMGIIEEFAKVNIEPPMNQAGMPEVIEKLKEKRDQWKNDQEKKTRENIEKAMKEIERMEHSETEAQEHPPSSSAPENRRSTKKPAVKNQAVNGTSNGTSNGAHSADKELAQEKDAVDDAAKDLEDAKIEESAEA